MSEPSDALRALERELERLENSTLPLTPATLLHVLRKAIDAAEYSEWEDRMGDSL